MQKYNFNKKYTLKDVDKDLYDLIQNILFGLVALGVLLCVSVVYGILGVIGCVLANEPLSTEGVLLYGLIGIFIAAALYGLIVIFIDVIHILRMRNLPVTVEELDTAGINTPEGFIDMLYWHAGKRIAHRFCQKQETEITNCFCCLIKNRPDFIGDQARIFLECYTDILKKWAFYG